MAAWTSRNSRSSTSSSASCARSLPMPPRAATSSRPCGAAAMSCASRMRSKSAFPPDQGLSTEPVRLTPPDWTPPQMAGFLFGGGVPALSLLGPALLACLLFDGRLLRGLLFNGLLGRLLGLLGGLGFFGGLGFLGWLCLY